MLLTYVDESFSKDRYYLAALVVPETEATPLTRALELVVAQASRDYPDYVRPTAELHGYDIVAGKNDWRGLAPFIRARIGIYDKALQAIAARDVKIVIRGVDIGRLQKRYPSPRHPHSVCLEHLIERVDEYAERSGELALLIADEVAGQAVLRDELGGYQRLWTWGYRSRKIEHIVDTIHFAPSAASRLVQAADLIAYMALRKIHVETDERAKRANELLWSRIEPKVWHQWCWFP